MNIEKFEHVGGGRCAEVGAVGEQNIGYTRGARAVVIIYERGQSATIALTAQDALRMGERLVRIAKASGGMTNTKHEVTVHDRAPATAQVSVAQVEAYLRRTGWKRREEYGRCFWLKHDATYADDREGYRPLIEFMPGRNKIAHAIRDISVYERRPPSAVLADIAREPTS